MAEPASASFICVASLVDLATRAYSRYMATPFLLLVEDSLADAALIEQGVKELPFDVELAHTLDGEEGLGVLVAALDRIGGTTPTMVILDLNLPGISGFEVLKQLKQHPRTKRIPVVVMSGSDRATDVRSALDSYANLYVQKADDVDAYLASVRDIATTFLAHGSWCLPPACEDPV